MTPQSFTFSSKAPSEIMSRHVLSGRSLECWGLGVSPDRLDATSTDDTTIIAPAHSATLFSPRRFEAFRDHASAEDCEGKQVNLSQKKGKQETSSFFWLRATQLATSVGFSDRTGM